jgi:uncharacterized radical SAM superfamily Fe-S cluster-containing enzyme/NAD-dependent SIR2 family protein deacetylase
MNELPKKLDTLWDWIGAAEHTVFFGGAGVSTSSGLADFRSAKSGLYNQQNVFGYTPEQILSRSFYDEHPREFFDFYRTKLLNLEARPNIVHLVLAELEAQGLLKAIITQNADNLHQRAGSKNVLDLHGNVYDNICMRCGKKHGADEIAGCTGIPYCDCGGIIRPGIVLFGEIPDVKTVFRCTSELHACDLLIVGGTSLRVSSAGRLLEHFNGKMAILNDEETAMDAQADLLVRCQITDAFSCFEKRMKRDINMNEILHETESLCPICLKKIPARYERIDGKAYMIKTCPEHGTFKVLFWRDADMYAAWKTQGVHAPAKDRGRPEKLGCPFDCGLCDEHHSGTCTAILEITYRCNMNCNICFADSNTERFEPSLDQIGKMYRAALNSNRFCSVQLSGGEPTVRDDLPEIVRLGKSLGIVHLQINTNGIRIAEDPEFLQALKDAGTDLIYLQFDGLKEEIYRKIRGREMMDIKLRAIENCAKARMGVLLVPVVIPGLNLDHLGDIVRFAKAHIPTVKGVHFQPVSYFGRFPGDVPPDESRCGIDDVIHALTEQMGNELKMEYFVPRKQFDPHCDFSSTFYLDEQGKLVPMSRFNQNDQDTEQTDFVAKTNCYTDKRWRYQSAKEKSADTLLKKFALRTLTHSFSISGKGFQDVWNVDLGRLHGCCVHIVRGDESIIPFCAFHLTSTDGRRLYKN